MTNEKKKEYQPSQAEQAMELLLNRKHELFHDPGGCAYYTVENGTKLTTYDVESDRFKSFLTALYHERFGVPIKDADRKRAIDTLAANAIHKAPCYQMFMRSAWHDGNIYIDLADDAGQVVEITPAGWRLTTTPPVRFVRSSRMAALPVPVKNGSLDALRTYINVGNEWITVGSWICDALRGRGPYHILVLNGLQGSAKSFTTELLRRLVDPLTDCQLSAMPENNRELAIYAKNHHVIALDNVSFLTQSQSDALCRLATGAGFAVRKLYTNDGLFAVSGAKPILLNGIPDFVEAPDLLDRCLIVECPPLTKRRKESELREGFATDHPVILGGLCSILSAALSAESPKDNNARMADSYDWMFRCAAAAGWGCERFSMAYAEKRELTADIAVESCFIAEIVEEFVTAQRGGAWYGVAKELHEAMNTYLWNQGRAYVSSNPAYPKTPKRLSSELKRHELSLRRLGVKCLREERGRAGRPIRLWIEPSSTPASPPPATAPIQEREDIEELFEREWAKSMSVV